MKKGGLKDENIIVFMYDDIAHSPENPRPGVIINHPQGGDVYAGVPKVTELVPPVKFMLVREIQNYLSTQWSSCEKEKLHRDSIII